MRRAARRGPVMALIRPAERYLRRRAAASPGENGCHYGGLRRLPVQNVRMRNMLAGTHGAVWEPSWPGLGGSVAEPC